MAVSVSLRKNNLTKKGLVGFSWTTLFFGFLLPVIRGDLGWAVLMLIAQIFSLCLANIVFAFIYNKKYTTKLLEDGYEPMDEYSKGMLRTKGIIS
ncbi:HrgC protein [Helicobacter pylori]|uniref:HrgC protein n=1 Tax=Helicobacter pylori TaxID=210 RepID=UPI000988EE06|nr:HrgC protein [Helicobacter pylori]OOC23370.1 HrgC protein [Helicobacter pylori]